MPTTTISSLARAAAVLFVTATFAASQIPVGNGTHSENFDAVLAGAATVMPAGWSVTSNNTSPTTLTTSDSGWAGTANNTAYNAALQSDLSRNGDSSTDRGLSLFATGQTETRYIGARFLNTTGGVITGLAITYDVALYASRNDSASTTRRWDGFFLRIDPGTGSFSPRNPSYETTFVSTDLSFTAGGGDPWVTGNGWATGPMFGANPSKKSVTASLTGLSIQPGAVFRVRWTSFDETNTHPAIPAAPAGLTVADHRQLNIGIDNFSITPTFTPPEAPPKAPSDETALAYNSTKIILDWADNSADETGFRIERATHSGGPWATAGSVVTNTRTFTDTVLIPQKTYFYRVYAVNGAGDATSGAVFSATTLAPDPGLVRFVASTYTITENAASGTVTLTLERVFDSAGAVSVSYETSDGAAIAADGDYTATTGSVSWLSGEEGVKTFTIPIANDSLIESNEDFTVTLTNSTGGLLIDNPSVAVVNINNDDFAGQLRFTAATLNIQENGGTANLTVQRTNGSAGPVTVDFSTAEATAVAGTDYTTNSGTLQWADGETADKILTVPILDNTAIGRAKTFQVILSNPSAPATLGVPLSSAVTILDNETGFVLLDDFSGLPVDTAPPLWTQNPIGADASFAARLDPAAPSNIVVGVKRLSANNVRAWYLPFAGDAVAQGATATLFTRVRLAGGAATDRFNLSIGLSDETTPTNNFGHFEAQSSVVNSSNDAAIPLQIRNGGVATAQTSLTRDQWYHLWLVINNQTDSYDVYLKSATCPAAAGDRIASGFSFRNGTASNPLRHLLFILGQNTTNNPEVFIDDLYLDRTAQNLTDPTASSPTGFAAWQQSAFPAGTPASQREPEADFDFDGVVNLIEYALGTNPAALSVVPAPSVFEDAGDRYLQLQWTRPDDRDDAVVSGETSADLTNGSWSSSAILVTTTVTPAGPGMETVTVRLLEPIGATAKRFLRARVTLP